jgi:hypothetical protein
MQAPLDVAHVQQVLASLLAHGFGELQVRVHNHVIVSLVPMPLLKYAEDVDEEHFVLTPLKARASVTRHVE